MKSIAIAALCTLSLTATASAQDIVGRNDETWTASERVTRGEWFKFYSATGEVVVTEGSGDRVEVRAEKILRRGARETDIGFVVLRGRDGVTICALYEEDDCDEDGIRSNWNNRRNRDGNRANLKVTIRVPRDVKLAARSGNGDVSVDGVSSDIDAASGNGKVRVNGGQDVHANSGNGEVTVEGARGPVDAHSGNGDVQITTATGPVSATSGNGDVIVSMTTLGERESMTFTTGNGRVRITVPSNFAAELEASTGNGEIVSDFPITVTGRLTKSHIRGTIGSGGPRLRLSSGNGTIELLRRGSAGER
jgi:hypothetical protein